MLPDHVNLILLSATVPNTKEFASWVGRTKKKDIYVISTPKRPVPLEFHLWANKNMYKIVDSNGKFLTQGYSPLRIAPDASSWKDANNVFNKNKEVTPVQPPTGRGRGRGGPNRSAAANIIQGRSNLRTIDRQDKNIWIHLVHHLRREKLLPVVIFVFSKRRCEENASVLTNIDLCSASEKSEVHVVVEKSIARLKAEDRGLPQIRRIRDLLSRGVAVHHGGLLPIVKEVSWSAANH